MAQPAAIVERCPHCGIKVPIGLSSVLVVYDEQDANRDRYQWSHGECPLVVKPFAGIAKAELEPFVGKKGIPASIRDREYDDPIRTADLPPIGPEDIAKMMRSLRHPRKS